MKLSLLCVSRKLDGGSSAREEMQHLIQRSRIVSFSSSKIALCRSTWKLEGRQENFGICSVPEGIILTTENASTFFPLEVLDRNPVPFPQQSHSCPTHLPQPRLLGWVSQVGKTHTHFLYYATLLYCYLVLKQAREIINYEPDPEPTRLNKRFSTEFSWTGAPQGYCCAPKQAFCATTGKHR